MRIKQIIVSGTTVYVFTDNPEKDILKFQELYTNDDATSSLGFPLGYEEPRLTEYRFLGVNYKCISLWFDNEDVPEFFTEFRNL